MAWQAEGPTGQLTSAPGDLLDLSSLDYDERSQAAARSILRSNDPPGDFERLIPILLHQKTLVAAIAHLEAAGADLSTFTVSSQLIRRLYPVNALMPEPEECAPNRMPLTGLRDRLVRHQQLLRETARDLARSGAWGETVLLFGEGMRAAYPACRSRMNHDVDLLSSDMPTATGLADAFRLAGGGLTRGRVMRVRGWWLGILSSVRHTDDGYEIHVDLVGGGWPPIRGFPPSPAGWVFRRARTVDMDGVAVRVPSAEDSLLLLADRTLRKDPFRPNWYPDARAILGTPDGLDWDHLVGTATSLHLGPALGRLVRMVEERSGLTLVPPEARAALRGNTLDRTLFAKIDADADVFLTTRRPGWPALTPGGMRALKRLRLLWFLRSSVRPVGPSWGTLVQLWTKVEGRAFRRELRFARAHRRPLRSVRLLRLLRPRYGSLCELRDQPAPPELGFCLSGAPKPWRPATHLDADAQSVLSPVVAQLPHSSSEVVDWTNKWGKRRHNCQNITYHLPRIRSRVTH
jgi:hypothetical protein